MESFAIGRGPRRPTRDEKLRAYRKAVDKRRKERLRAQNRAKSSKFTRPLVSYGLDLDAKQWLIIPGVTAEARNFIYYAGKNIVEIMTSVRIKNGRRFRTTIFKNQRVRNAFSALARRWLFKRAKQGNEEDLVTGEAPVKPVTLFDWPSRTKYVFEASTIRRDMMIRLLTSTAGFFPKPQYPRNPYTNMVLRQSEFHSILQQLRAYGYTHWTLEGLASYYCIDTFGHEMFFKLKATIVKNLFADHTNPDGIARVMEFMAERFDDNDKPFYVPLFRWALENKPLHPIIISWRNICYDFYTTDSSNTVKLNHISRQAEFLCGTSHILQALRDKTTSSSNSSANTP